MKIVTVVGARPQFIKAATVSRVIQGLKKQYLLEEILIHTGQHYDYLMDRVFFEELELPKPDYHLGVGSGSHGAQTGTMLEKIEAVLVKEKPDLVLVYGDTNSTLAGALAAAKMNLPVAHVEAGLRSYNRRMPEEINRLLTDHLAGFLFCPTDQAVKNLAKEGIKDLKGKVVKKVGDVMYDSILYYSELAEEKSSVLKSLGLQLKTRSSEPKTHDYYLATLHRAENTDDPNRLRSILKALDEIGKRACVVFPLHPRTKKMMKAHLLYPKSRRIQLIEPVSYLDMLHLEKNAKVILTDSGGIQKEAYWLKVPCLTLRDETEWVETVKSGWNVLVGSQTNRIVKEVSRGERPRRDRKRNRAFGNGRASQKIIHTLANHWVDEV